MRLLPGMVMLMLVLVIAGSARATTDVMPFKDEAQEQQFRQLTEQLRCPKCQNNSIADSNAMIATDMRRRVYDLMQEGKSRQEIIDYMVARYGNFVTYDPPLTPLTVLLWVLPLAAIVAGGWIIVARTRRRVRLRREPLPADTPVCGARAGWGVYVPGAVIALVVAAISYSQTGSYQQVRAWQQATAQTPGLLARALDPKNSDAALGYAEALTRSSDPEDNRRGGELLRRLVSRDHTDIRVLSLYAFSAFEQQRFDEAVAAWEMMLKLLPAGDARRAVIERSIRLAQDK
ncbi:cytochrome c-type biogenesis protein CcmH [Salmonella enterica]|nr:cytochrome c biogenesis protein CcmH [Salmonella enterica]EFT2516851.1 cytochrome c biogenesis protein CcmH [Salmonella enterica]EIO0068908.1 cytochrome c-type biogenesis protein CcmH [Salmonella enterica]ELR9808056.1 cytochrome c-type biogenesis protein CcmH [Salmonella enterica]ELT2698512.1 cytochrome c-type biogenesis protein CcmH [Salmonella enterica]